MTKKQEKLHNFIEARQVLNLPPPSFREMREHMGVTSNETITGHLELLEKQGMVKNRNGKYYATPIERHEWIYENGNLYDKKSGVLVLALNNLDT